MSSDALPPLPEAYAHLRQAGHFVIEGTTYFIFDMSGSYLVVDAFGTAHTDRTDGLNLVEEDELGPLIGRLMQESIRRAW